MSCVCRLAGKNPVVEVVFASSTGEDVYQCLPIVINRGNFRHWQHVCLSSLHQHTLATHGSFVRWYDGVPCSRCGLSWRRGLLWWQLRSWFWWCPDLIVLQGRTPDKMASFSVIRKKTPFQKHREEEDAKKKVTWSWMTLFLMWVILGSLSTFLSHF